MIGIFLPPFLTLYLYYTHYNTHNQQEKRYFL
nr:MAG TPA: ubiquinol-cytochrome-c reductase complex core protein [Caudoviricetes sp.]DAS00913.1 MAG TPA: ubiquinol-cytochrome-c reductase complex core protein [Caudoviricetes sp.]